MAWIQILPLPIIFVPLGKVHSPHEPQFPKPQTGRNKAYLRAMMITWAGTKEDGGKEEEWEALGTAHNTLPTDKDSYQKTPTFMLGLNSSGHSLNPFLSEQQLCLSRHQELSSNSNSSPVPAVCPHSSHCHPSMLQSVHLPATVTHPCSTFHNPTCCCFPSHGIYWDYLKLSFRSLWEAVCISPPNYTSFALKKMMRSQALC